MASRKLPATPLAIGLALILCGVASAEDLRVPGTHRTLDQALRAAESGDRILVRRGTHDVSRAIRTPNLTIVGKRARLRSSFDVVADGVTIEGFTLKRGDVRVFGDDVTIRNNKFRGGALLSYGNDAVIDGNRFKNTNAMAAVEAHGRRAAVSDNRFKDVGCGVLMTGDDGTISDNDFDDTDESAIVAEADDVTIDQNEIDDVDWMDAITVTGDGASVTGNDVDDAPGGINLTGDGFDVSDNDLDVGFANPDLDTGMANGCPAITIDTDHIGGIVADNDVTHTTGSGIVVDGDGTAIVDNTVTGHNGQVSIEVDGDLNTVSGNTVEHTGNGGQQDVWRDPAAPSPADGISIDGNANLVDQNVITDTFGDGIDVEGSSNDVVGNTIDHAGDDAIDVQGGSNLIGQNVVTKPVDTGIDVDGNKNDIDENLVDRPGAEAFLIDGNKNDVDDNVADRPGTDGFIVGGKGNDMIGNTVDQAGGCGVLLTDPVDIDQCSVGDCDMGGLVNLESGTTLSESTITSNSPVDVVDLGGIGSLDGNVIGQISSDPQLAQGAYQQARDAFGAPDADPSNGGQDDGWWGWEDGGGWQEPGRGGNDRDGNGWFWLF